jgi:hypothetical protein
MLSDVLVDVAVIRTVRIDHEDPALVRSVRRGFCVNLVEDVDGPFRVPRGGNLVRTRIHGPGMITETIARGIAAIVKAYTCPTQVHDRTTDSSRKRDLVRRTAGHVVMAGANGNMQGSVTNLYRAGCGSHLSVLT